MTADRKLLGREPTPEMIEAPGREIGKTYLHDYIQNCWRAMWDAALAPVAAEPVGPPEVDGAGYRPKSTGLPRGEPPNQGGGCAAPSDLDAIKATARAEALEEAARWHDDQAALHAAHAAPHPTGSDAWKYHVVEEAGHKLAAAAIRALAGQPADDGWRPIADCPSDGSDIWVAGGRFEEPTLTPADGEWWRKEIRLGAKAPPRWWNPLVRPAPPRGGEHG